MELIGAKKYIKRLKQRRSRIMMLLQQTSTPNEVRDEGRFDFLKGISNKVLRMDELHASDGDDWNYIYLIWLKDYDDEDKFVKALKNNIKGINDWLFRVWANDIGLIGIYCCPET